MVKRWVVFFGLVFLVGAGTVRAQTGLLGDANGDGKVDGVDYVIWLNHYGQNVSGSAVGDFNSDGKVDGVDYVIWLNHYGSLAQPTPTSGSKPAPVFLRIGSGVSDVIPHQIVRTNANMVYTFSPTNPGQSNIKSAWASGFPVSGTDFAAGNTTSVTTASYPVSVDAAYDGKSTIIVTANLANGSIVAYPFDIQTNTFKSPVTLGSDGNTQYHDIGTSGVSTGFDTAVAQQFHLAYWANANSIIYKSYMLSNFALSQSGQSFQVNGSESPSANHPSLAVSPQDGSVTVVWVNGTNGSGSIYSRSKSATGTWGQVQKVNSADVWTSPNSGLNIDQGPSLLITADGIKHLVYIQDWKSTSPYDYGQVHYCENSGSAWSDQGLTFYSHDPALAADQNGALYILGHGYPLSTTSVADCKSVDNLCVATRPSGQSWNQPQLISKGSTTYGFDSSVSVKWSVAGWNRPDLVEFVVFSTNNGSYSNTSLWYGRL